MSVRCNSVRGKRRGEQAGNGLVTLAATLSTAQYGATAILTSYEVMKVDEQQETLGYSWLFLPPPLLGSHKSVVFSLLGKYIFSKWQRVPNKYF